MPGDDWVNRRENEENTVVFDDAIGEIWPNIILEPVPCKNKLQEGRLRKLQQLGCRAICGLSL
jgi:hypothetical protein